MPKLPPLSALRAFEATARHMSAKRAAAELHVTPAAVSHQIKALETFHGVKLFKRLNRQLLLTDKGQKYAVFLTDIFKKLYEESIKITQQKIKNISITVEPAFAIYWLIPRIEKFKKKFKNIEFRISASFELIDLKKENMDVGIRWGNGKYPGLTSHLLFHNKIYPVCSPALIKKHAIRKPNDLKYHTLLHETAAIAQSDDYPDWRTWVKEVKANEVNPEIGLYFETGYLLIQAAIDGQGIALERDALVNPAIKSGKLIKLFKHVITETLNGYYVVYPQERAIDPNILSFVNWLRDEVKKTNTAE
jgi:LysR family glycine cleavage system transcriptional activator